MSDLENDVIKLLDDPEWRDRFRNQIRYDLEKIFKDKNIGVNFVMEGLRTSQRITLVNKLIYYYKLKEEQSYERRNEIYDEIKEIWQRLIPAFYDEQVYNQKLSYFTFERKEDFELQNESYFPGSCYCFTPVFTIKQLSTFSTNWIKAMLKEGMKKKFGWKQASWKEYIKSMTYIEKKILKNTTFKTPDLNYEPSAEEVDSEYRYLIDYVHKLGVKFVDELDLENNKFVQENPQLLLNIDIEWLLGDDTSKFNMMVSRLLGKELSTVGDLCQNIDEIKIGFESNSALTCIVNRLEGELVRYHLLGEKGSNLSRKRWK